MARFTIRIELHGAEPNDYPTLHKSMEAAGFLRTIEGSRGTYKLPEAEYSLIGPYNLDQAFEMAKKAAGMAGEPFSILTTEVAGYRKFLNLDKADE